MDIPRAEHPNPQWARRNWVNLNGEWDFEFDFSASALERELYNCRGLNSKITVPFCPESKLSGVGYTDFIPAACYMKTIYISKENLKGRVILHFGAVDYRAFLYINGQYVGDHRGGYTAFEFDITDKLIAGKNRVFLYVEDDIRGGRQCSGKQSDKKSSYKCYYTRVTGIWQTVWLEFVPKKYIKYARFYTDVRNAAVTILGETCGSGKLEIKASYAGNITGSLVADVSGMFCVTVNLSEKHLWEVYSGGLYDLELVFGEDRVQSYFGLREITIEGYKVLVNGKPVFQRLVLDQGYYPDGIYTAPNDKALENDISISLAAGFNGARLHEKVFEPRFLYHADRLGYLVWEEYPNWGIKKTDEAYVFADVINGWRETIHRDFNHPSIIGWCPFNETWLYNEHKKSGNILSTVYQLTKELDSTRPCIDTSGNYHVMTDIYDVHDYTQDCEKFAGYFKSFDETGDFDYKDTKEDKQPFFQKYYKYKKGMPAFVSEYGGIKWDVDKIHDEKMSWGYGDTPATEQEFIERYKGLTECLLFNKNMFGFCYTQLYDVEQEKNGIYTYNREPKMDIKVFRDINTQKASIEKSDG